MAKKGGGCFILADARIFNDIIDEKSGKVASFWLTPEFAMTTMTEINKRREQRLASPIAALSSSYLPNAFVIANEVKQPPYN